MIDDEHSENIPSEREEKDAPLVLESETQGEIKYEENTTTIGEEDVKINSAKSVLCDDNIQDTGKSINQAN